MHIADPGAEPALTWAAAVCPTLNPTTKHARDRPTPALLTDPGKTGGSQSLRLRRREDVTAGLGGLRGCQCSAKPEEARPRGRCGSGVGLLARSSRGNNGGRRSAREMGWTPLSASFVLSSHQYGWWMPYLGGTR